MNEQWIATFIFQAGDSTIIAIQPAGGAGMAILTECTAPRGMAPVSGHDRLIDRRRKALSDKQIHRHSPAKASIDNAFNRNGIAIPDAAQLFDIIAGPRPDIGPGRQPNLVFP